MMYLTTLFVFALAVASFAITPYITRKTESFGVTIPEEHHQHPTISQYRKKFVWYTSLFGLILIAILFGLIFILDVNTWMIVYTVAIFIYLPGAFLIYLHYHKKMKVMKETEKWYDKKKAALAIDTQFYKKKLTYSNWFFAIPFAISILTLVLTFMNYDRFPERLPMQYDMAGQVTRWADKSLGSLMSFPLLQLFLTGLFLFINIVISRSKQLLDPAKPEVSVQQNIIFRRRWSMFSIISSIAMVLLFSLAQLSFILKINSNVWFAITMAVTIAIVIGAIVLSVTTGQGGSRVKIASGKNGEVIHRDDDKYWKLGVFYFNPDDPAIFVEKRFGAGWTNNWARPVSWILLIGIILIPILIALLTG